MTEYRSYAEYIQSDDWGARRAAYFKAHEKVCMGCEAKTNIHLHHLTYERMGAELDSDLMPLCEACHDMAHQLHRANAGRMSLREATMHSIRWGRGETARRVERTKRRRGQSKSKRNGRRKKRLSPVAQHNAQIRAQVERERKETRQREAKEQRRKREHLQRQRDRELMERYGAKAINEIR